MPSNLPLARTDDLLVEELDDELLVYDQKHDVASRLNRTAALVWQNSDGEQSVDDLVALLHDELGEIADEDLVLVTLDRLHEQGLIESGYEPQDANTSRLSRRRFIRRVGVVGSAALALPVVQSVVAPTAAMAASVCAPCTCPCGCSTCPDCSTCGYCEPTCAPSPPCFAQRAAKWRR